MVTVYFSLRRVTSVSSCSINCLNWFEFVQELGRDIYDLYAEYEEEEEEEDPLPVSPCPLLLSPNKPLILNINVGGTVTSLVLHNNMLLQLTYC